MAVKIFFCYAHEDEALLNKLKTQLRPLQRDGLIDVWYDRDISAGAEWEQEIRKHLNDAQIILLLISPDFMNSEYCYGIEMKRALERHERGEARVIPVILEYVYWQIAPLIKLQALPTDAEPILSKNWYSQNEALYNIVQGVKKVVGEIRKGRDDEVEKAQEKGNETGKVSKTSLVKEATELKGKIARSELRGTPSSLELRATQEEGEQLAVPKQPIQTASPVILPYIGIVHLEYDIRRFYDNDVTRLYELSLAPDLTRIAVSAGDYNHKMGEWWTLNNRLEVRDITNGKVLKVLDENGDKPTYYAYSRLAWSPNGKFIATEGNLIWDVETSKKLGACNHSHALLAVSWSPDSNFFVSTTFNSTKIFSIAAQGMVYNYYSNAAYDDYAPIAWSPDSRYIALKDETNGVAIHEIMKDRPALPSYFSSKRDSNEKPIVTYRGKGLISAISWSPDTKLIATGEGNKKIWVWDAMTGKKAFSSSRFSKRIKLLVWSPDSRYIAVVEEKSTIIHIMLAVHEAPIYEFNGHKGVDADNFNVEGLMWSSDSKSIVSSDSAGRILIWQVA